MKVLTVIQQIRNILCLQINYVKKWAFALVQKDPFITTVMICFTEEDMVLI